MQMLSSVTRPLTVPRSTALRRASPGVTAGHGRSSCATAAGRRAALLRARAPPWPHQVVRLPVRADEPDGPRPDPEPLGAGPVAVRQPEAGAAAEQLVEDE